MSCDKLVFDLSQEVEGSPNVFIRKDWINILDNQNQNYQNNQSIIDTSQLANSNKYMGYREAYLAVPMLLSMRTPVCPSSGDYLVGDYSIGLKNWFGSIIHSMTLDYNGTTIVQQTPFCNMWNSFKLLTTLSWGDVSTMGSAIGFYPDSAGSWGYWTASSGNGYAVCNNDLGLVHTAATSVGNTNDFTQYNTTSLFGGNIGATYRTKWIAYDTASGSNSSSGVASSTYGSVGLASGNITQIWRSNISSSTTASTATTTNSGLLQISVMATIYLKHIHSFFNMCPLLKGVFMKLTLNLNNSKVDMAISSSADSSPLITAGSTTSTVYVGGVQPLLIPSARTGSVFLTDTSGPTSGTIYYDLTVGSKSYNTQITSHPLYSEGNVSKSVYLYVPAYTFNPTFEQAYLSNSIKQIKYTDIYQYQVKSIGSLTQFNNLITNGIANIKSVLIIPFFEKDYNGTSDYQEFQSPFDPAGCGPTAPMVNLGNFNVQISGQNAIYNMQRYSFEEWNNQLYGQNAVNGGLTDGLTSGLIDFSDFQNSYCYYYVNVERMLPVEQSVPKSVQILGTNYSQRSLNLWVFIEYGVQVSIDVLTGARV
jgi:hypothetical protein